MAPRRTASACTPDTAAICPAGGQLAMLASGQAEMFSLLRGITETVGDIRVLGAERAADVRELRGELSAHIAAQADHAEGMTRRVDDHAELIEAIRVTIEEREDLFRHARRLGLTVVTGIGLVVLGTILYAGAWTVKKLFGIDISPFLRG